jgi:hypothetical protein
VTAVVYLLIPRSLPSNGSVFVLSFLIQPTFLHYPNQTILIANYKRHWSSKIKIMQFVPIIADGHLKEATFILKNAFWCIYMTECLKTDAYSTRYFVLLFLLLPTEGSEFESR